MGNNKNDILGSLTNILSNIDLNQIVSLIGSLKAIKGSNSSSGNNAGSALGNFDLGKLSEAFANLTSSQPRQEERRPSFFNGNNMNPNNFTPNNFTPNNFNNNYSGIFDMSNLQSLFSNVTEQLEGLRNFRFK